MSAGSRDTSPAPRQATGSGHEAGVDCDGGASVSKSTRFRRKFVLLSPSMLLLGLIFAYDDAYVPELARRAVSAVAEMTDEDCEVQLAVAAIEAECESMRN